MAGWLAAASPDRPVVLLLDDLHWATKPTMLMLKHIVRFTGPMALLIIGTYRDSDLTRSHPLSELLADLRRESRVERLTLATTLGRYDEADRHFAAAAELEKRIGSRALLVHTQLEWARALLYRGQPGDKRRTLELLKEALDAARELGLTGTERRIQTVLDEAGQGADEDGV